MFPPVIGIDPGLSGGMAFIPSSGPAEALPFRDFDAALNWLRSVQNRAGRGLLGSIEFLTGFVGTAVPSHTMLKLGENSGQWKGLIQALNIPLKAIPPQVWQKPFQLSGTPKPERKRMLKQLAADFFPDSDVTLKTCDALLIARHFRAGLGK